jgi:hypothetical protein
MTLNCQLEAAASSKLRLETDPYEKHLEVYGAKAPEVSQYLFRAN